MSTENSHSIGEQTSIDPSRPIFYFDLTEVLARSPGLKRNPERALLMCEHCVKKLAPADLMLPEEIGFFLVISSADNEGAEGLVQEIANSLSELFFGTDALNNGIGSICRRATLEELQKKNIQLPARAERKLAPIRQSDLKKIEPDPLVRLADSGVPGYDGVSTAFMPLTDLRRDTAPLYLCGPVRKIDGKILFGEAAMALASFTDRACLDEAMLEYSLGFARNIVPTQSATAIIASVHYETLAWSRGRQLYQKALRQANAANNPFFMVKIAGIPAGTPGNRLAEITAMVRPFVRRMFLELQDWDRSLLSSGFLGAAGLITSMPQEGGLLAAAKTLRNLVQLASAQQAVACATDVANEDQLRLAQQLGVRFGAALAGPSNILAVPPSLTERVLSDRAA